MSDQIDQLATSLAKAQGEMEVARKDKNNPYFKSKYADLESVIAASRPALTKYGLSVVQNVYQCSDSHHYLITLLLHSSGQWIKSKAQHNPQKNDIQSLSSYNTYLRRMCYTSLVGVATGDDDDGEAAVSSHRATESHARQTIPYSPDKLTDQEKSSLMALNDATKDFIKEKYNVINVTDLSRAQYKDLITSK